MTNVNSTNQAGLLSNYQKRATPSNRVKPSVLKRNDEVRQDQLESTKKDAKVSINDAVKDFSRIKKAVDAAPPIDNSEKIAALKAQIEKGEYKVDYEGLADKILSAEL